MQSLCSLNFIHSQSTRLVPLASGIPDPHLASCVPRNTITTNSNRGNMSLINIYTLKFMLKGFSGQNCRRACNNNVYWKNGRLARKPSCSLIACSTFSTSTNAIWSLEHDGLWVSPDIHRAGGGGCRPRRVGQATATHAESVILGHRWPAASRTGRSSGSFSTSKPLYGIFVSSTTRKPKSPSADVHELSSSSSASRRTSSFQWLPSARTSRRSLE